jgi:hypothetical protein
MCITCRRLIAFRLLLSLALLFVTMVSFAQQPPRKPEAWDTCIFVEGKGDFCHAAEKARKFEDYLGIAWMFDPVDGFTLNSPFNFKPAEHKINPVWQEVEQLGDSRVRSVKYLIDDALNGPHVILAERKDGLWIPLMKIAGDLPEPVVLRDGAIIGMSRDFGGNIPMVRTWAWISSAAGPIALDVDGAANEAVQKVAAGWDCYNTGIEWNTLHTQTACWQGEWRNKPSVRHKMDAWFDLKDGKLAPKQVDLSPIDLPGAEAKHWP